MDCSECVWSNPDTCRNCKAEEMELEVAKQVVQVKQVEVFDGYKLPNGFEVFVN